MGQEVSTPTLCFVSFEPATGAFRAYLSIHTAVAVDQDPEDLAQEAAAIYQCFIRQMRLTVKGINALRETRTPVPARKVWRLGDSVFQLVHELAELELQLDGVYDHLSRDLGVKRKWLEKVVILRRYIDDLSLIPESLNWGRLEKGTARIAKGIANAKGSNGGHGHS
jgi:hypothetical protein